MLINATAQNELRIAIVEDGELVELDIEAAETSTLKSNIYKGVVHNVEGSLEAAFVDIGAHKQGFLPFSEVAASQYYRPWNEGGRPKITDVLRRGQDILVQVAKDAIGEKGATLTTYLSLPGRYTVLMPGSDAGGISRKIDDEKVRKQIKSIATKIKKPDNCGFIIRTAGLHQTRMGIQKDLDNLVAQYEKILKTSQIARAPSILHAEPDLIARTLRDYFNEEIDEVQIDNREEFEAAVQYFNDVMPDYTERLKFYQNPIPIFAYYHVEEQIEATFERVVQLPSGGSIVIDTTEALVAIDVNSGKNTGEGGHEETVYKTNCEAAEEVARQLKLRDLGGIVVVDFIDMEVSKHKREVESVLSEAAKDDKARYKISRINSKGLCVLTRQRIRQGMRKAFQRRCEICSGTGWLRTGESHSLSVLRRVETRLAQGEVGEVRVLTHKETAEYLANHKRQDLLRLEREYHCRILVFARAEMDRGKDEVSYLSKGQILSELTDRLPQREERRNDRGSKRKKRLKKKRSPESNLEPSGTDDIMSELPGEAQPGGKKKKRRRRGRDGEKLPLPVAADGAPPPPPPESRPMLEAKGDTTFTGRPSPEVLARLKAERKARMTQKRAPGLDVPADLPSEVRPADLGASPPPAAEVPTPAAVDGAEAPEKRSLLDRLFGSR